MARGVPAPQPRLCTSPSAAAPWEGCQHPTLRAKPTLTPFSSPAGTLTRSEEGVGAETLETQHTDGHRYPDTEWGRGWGRDPANSAHRWAPVPAPYSPAFLQISSGMYPERGRGANSR